MLLYDNSNSCLNLISGSLLFNLTKDVGDTVTFAISSRQTGTNLKPQYNDRLKQCFILTTGDTWFALTLNKTLDLEYFYAAWVGINHTNLDLLVYFYLVELGFTWAYMFIISTLKRRL